MSPPCTHSAWPTLACDPVALAWVHACLAAQHGGVPDAGDAMWLAAWLRDPNAAVAALVTTYRGLLDEIGRRHGLGPADCDELASHVWGKLLRLESPEAEGCHAEAISQAPKPDGAPTHVPVLARYLGRGQLGGLIRVVATRLALGLASQGRARSGPLAPPPRTVDAVAMKAELQPLLVHAIEAAAATLTPRQRRLLRLHLLQHATIDDLARLYAVNRSTSARWLAEAKRIVREGSTANFLALASLTEGDLPELASLLESQLSVSWSRLLASSASGVAGD